MAFDFKKEYREFYLPKNKPSIVEVPAMNYLAVWGHGDPNGEGSEYKNSIELLYGMAYTLKMSPKDNHHMEGFFDYVVPPLEGFWWHDEPGMDYSRKDNFHFISAIRLPDFVTEADFRWAMETATAKKKKDFSPVKFWTYDEGTCVQCMHLGPYDTEPETVAAMHAHMAAQGYALDISDSRLHHEIYLSDPRKAAGDKLKTVVRHPVRKV